MKKGLMLTIFLILLPILARADNGFLDIEQRVPKVMIQTDSIGGVFSWKLERYETYTFSGFSPGSSDIPKSAIPKIKELTDKLGPNQYMFIQGRTDSIGWKKRYNKNDDDLLNLDLGWIRGQKVLEFVREYRSNISDNTRLLYPVSVSDGRGVDIHIACYTPPSEKKVPKRTDDSPLVNYKEVSKTDTVFTGLKTHSTLRVGGGIGLFGVVLADSNINFYVPTLNLDFKKGSVGISLYAGWRPKSERPDSLGKRAESLVGSEFTLRYHFVGFSIGTNCAWETLQKNKEFLKRAFGFYIGPEICFGSEDFNLRAGINFQELNLNRYRVADSWWNNGYSWSVRTQYFLR